MVTCNDSIAGVVSWIPPIFNNYFPHIPMTRQTLQAGCTNALCSVFVQWHLHDWLAKRQEKLCP
jgi:hypothetical protein